jgi:hypothetical protein
MAKTIDIFYDNTVLTKVIDLFKILSSEYLTYYEEDNYIVFIYGGMFDISLEHASNILLEASFMEFPQIYNIFSIVENYKTKLFITFDNIQHESTICPCEVIEGQKSVYVFNRKLNISEIISFINSDSEMITVANIVSSKTKSIIEIVYYASNQS